MIRRLFVLAHLIVYAATVALAPVADAERERAAVAPVAHVEALGSKCPPAHDHLACRLCRVVRATPERSEPARIPIVATAQCPVASSVDERLDHIAAAPNAARAPPAI